MRRKPGTLVPLELAICEIARTRGDDGQREFYGYEMAKRLAAASDTRRPTAFGTLYRALARLERAGLVTSRWEAPDRAARESRPARRLYRLTALGERAVREAHAARTRPKPARRRWVPA